ncbi:MAG: DnaJ domain-containing protein [Bacteroidia bacterium]|nr:DnaJ domain-containing protein [Bacteroidia bacterium]
MTHYYQILDLAPGASVAEVKKAYRKKAMQWHPDKNNDPQAKQKFIEITEAYFALTNPAKSNRFKSFSRANPFTRGATAKRREDPRERARRAAQMRYEEWLKSDEYEFENAFGVFMQHLMLLVIGLFLGGCLISFLFSDGGVISIVLLLIFLGPIYFSMIYNSENISLANFVASFKVLQSQRPVGEVFLTLLNVFVILRIGLQTLLPHNLLLPMYVLIGALAYLYFRKKEVFSLSLISIGLAPSVMSVFLLLNYFISYDAHSENHSFSIIQQSFEIRKTDGSCTNLFTTIQLENKVYKDYPGIRFFFDNNQMCYCNIIHYEFKHGIFGFRVMRDYKPLYESP